MWYNDTQQLYALSEVAFPDGFILNDANRDVIRDGWYFSETQPDWLKELERLNLTELTDENE
jgi:hypothetical protein